MLVVSPDDFSYVTVLGSPAAKGEAFTVSGDVAAMLCEQGWRPGKSKSANRQMTPEFVAPLAAPIEE